MTFREDLDWYHKAMIRAKETHVRTGAAEEPPSLHVFRKDDDGDELVPVAVLVLHGDTETIGKAIQITAAGMSADAMIFSYESLTTRLTVNPVNGEPWEPGDLTVLADEYPDAYKDGWVLDGWIVMGYSRDGEWYITQDAYAIDSDEVVWGVHDEFLPGQEGEVLAFDGLIDIMTYAMTEMPTLQEKAKEMGEGKFARFQNKAIRDPTSETSQMLQDVATVRRLRDEGAITAVMMQAAKDSERASLLSKAEEFVTENLPGHRVTVYQTDKDGKLSQVPTD